MCEGIEKTSCELDFETIARSISTALALLLKNIILKNFEKNLNSLKENLRRKKNIL